MTWEMGREAKCGQLTGVIGILSAMGSFKCRFFPPFFGAGDDCEVRGNNWGEDGGAEEVDGGRGPRMDSTRCFLVSGGPIMNIKVVYSVLIPFNKYGSINKGKFQLGGSFQLIGLQSQ